MNFIKNKEAISFIVSIELHLAKILLISVGFNTVLFIKK